MSHSDSTPLEKINAVLQSAVRSAVQEVNLGRDREEQLLGVLGHLEDIVGIYR